MDFAKARFNMVEQQIRPWNVLDFDLLDVLDAIPREIFVTPEQQGYAYADMALPLQNGGFMLEPKVVARMVQGLSLKKSDRVLEIGTGSGYATAVLAKLAGEVITCDIDNDQLLTAKSALSSLHIDNVQYENQDGLSHAAPLGEFNAIYVGGSVESIPEALKKQLTEGGRMVVVAGSEPVQRCILITRQQDEFTQITLFDTLIAPLEGARPKWYKATGKFTF